MKTIQVILILIFSILAFNANARDRDYRKIIDLKGYWKFNIGDKEIWSDPDFNDSEWSDIFVPAAWEGEGFHGYDGFAWYRVNFELKKDERESYYIELGYIDDADQVYLNGEMIGYTGGFPPDFYTAYQSYRRYYLPTELLNDGINTLAIRVYDTVLDGGILKGNIGIYVREDLPEDVYLLEGIWDFKSSDRTNRNGPWREIMVPSFWKSMKFMHGYKKGITFSGMATYEKTFMLPEFLQDENNLVVVLGKIDDFDEVFLNGVKIGETNDHKPFGASDSYRQYRVYGLYESSLNRYGVNTLTVQVTDLGGDAGIYEGPIAITTTEQYNRLIDNYRN